MSPTDRKRRLFLKASAAIGATAALGALLPACGGGGGGGGSGGNLKSYRAIDAHAHPSQFYTPTPGTVDPSSTIETIVAAGMAASSFAAIGDFLFLSTGNTAGDEYANTVGQLARAQTLADGGTIKIALTTADIPEFSSSTVPPAAILSIEGGDALMGDIDNVEAFYDLGVRLITLVHYRNNQLGDIMRANPSRAPGAQNGGLTAFGGQVVGKMEELGILVDVAHANTATLEDICDIVTKPVVDSHTSPHPSTPTGETRLRTMAEMELIAGTGGAVCLWPLWWEGTTLSRKTFANWAAEIASMKASLGIDHIALGTDGGGNLPQMLTGYSGVQNLYKLADAMGDAGLSESDIAAFFGGNLLRILEATID